MLAAGKSRNSVKAMVAPLSEMFNHAVEDGHLISNPAARIMRRTRSEQGGQHDRINFLTRDEVARLLDTCQREFCACYPFVLCLARTGVR